MKPIHAFAAFSSVLVLAGCPSSFRTWAEIPGPPPMTAVVGELVEVPGISVSQMGTLGAPAPSPAKIVSAQCDDASVCEISGSAPFRVAGKRAGQTTISVEYVHPFDGTHDRRRVPATFVVATTRELALGDEAMPCGQPNTLASKDAVVRCELRDFPLPDGKKVPYLCDPVIGNGHPVLREKIDVGSDARGNARLFSCRQKDATPWEPREKGQDHVVVCEDAPLAVGSKSKALWVYRATGDKYVPTLTLVDKRGEPRDVCSLR